MCHARLTVSTRKFNSFNWFSSQFLNEINNLVRSKIHFDASDQINSNIRFWTYVSTALSERNSKSVVIHNLWCESGTQDFTVLLLWCGVGFERIISWSISSCRLIWRLYYSQSFERNTSYHKLYCRGLIQRRNANKNSSPNWSPPTF